MTALDTLDLHINRAYFDNEATYRALIDVKAVFVASGERNQKLATRASEAGQRPSDAGSAVIATNLH